MTEEFNNLLKRVGTAKGLTVILIVVFLGLFVWRNIDFLTEISFTLKKQEPSISSAKRDTPDEKSNGVSQLEIGDISMPLASKKLPSYISIQITNPGSAATNKVHASIDFGSTIVVAYEVIGPKPGQVSGSEPNQSVLNIDFEILKPHESAYIYAQITAPIFKKISLSSKDTVSVIDYTFSDYTKKTTQNNTNSGFVNFLWFLLGAFILVMSIYLTIALINVLNRYFKIE